MADPEIFLFFCDDFRQEVGNKVSLMGLYGPELLVAENSAALRTFVAGALCRFRSTEAVECKFWIEFLNDDPEAQLPPPPPPNEFILEPPETETGVWTSQVYAGVFGLVVQFGMIIRATIEIAGSRHSAELKIGRQKQH